MYGNKMHVEYQIVYVANSLLYICETDAKDRSFLTESYMNEIVSLHLLHYE